MLPKLALYFDSSCLGLRSWGVRPDLPGQLGPYTSNLVFPQASWSSLRTDYPTLTPAQLHHLLSHYQLGPGRGAPPAWDPPPAERDAVDTGVQK